MTALAAAVTPEIWRPQLWTPGREWRPKPLPYFTKRTWRKAKEDALVEAITVSQGVSGDTTTASAASATITAPSSTDVIVCVWCGVGGTGTAANANPPVHTGSTFAMLNSQAFGSALGTMDIWISTTTGTGTTVTQLPATAIGGSLLVLVCQNLSNNSGTALDGFNSSGDTSTSPTVSGNVTTVNANDILINVAFSRTLQSPGVIFTAPGAPWTTPINVSMSTTVHARTLSYRVVAATSTYSLSQVYTNSGTAVNVRSSIWGIKEAVASTPNRKSNVFRGMNQAVMMRGRR